LRFPFAWKEFTPAMFRRMYSSSFFTYARCFSSSRSRVSRRSARCGTNWL